MLYSYEDYRESAAFVRNRLPFFPETALVLGSGLSEMIRDLDRRETIPYEIIPHLQPTGVSSHEGALIVGELAGIPLLVLSGRFHFYEGYSMEQTAFLIRVLSLLGIKRVILTNAAGGVNESYAVGSLMLIRDHIKLTEDSPVRGKNLDEFGARFFDMSDAYSGRLRSLARETAAERGIPLQEGVYFYMPGPQFETPAEIRAVRLLGGDAVGMSTVWETIAAVQCGIEVLGFSCITNMAAGVSPSPLSGDEVVEVGRKASGQFAALIEGLLKKL